MRIVRVPRRLAAAAAVTALAGTLAALGLAALSAPAIAEQDPTPADCAATGVALANGGFETPAQTPGSVSFLPAAGGLPPWQTTDTVFEVWTGSAYGVPAAEGNQHVELNAVVAGTLYQAVPTTPGSVVEWRFAHRARLTSGAPGSAQDTMELLIGPSFAGVVSQGEFTDDDLDWGYHSGFYVVPPGQTTTYFAFRAVSTSSGNPSTGNFLDDISFASRPCLTVTTAIAGPGPGAVQRGDVLTVTATIRNDGLSTASATQVAAAIPAQTTYVPDSLTIDGVPVSDAAADDAGEIASAGPVWRVGAGAGPGAGGTLAPGESATVTYQVRVAATATGSIAATSTGDGAWSGSGPLPTATSNTATVPLALADLAVSKAAGTGPPIAGAALDFTVAATNHGPDDARQIAVVDPLPAGLLDAAATPDPTVPGGQCVVAAGVATCTYPLLPAGATASSVIAGRLDPGTTAGSVVANTATVQALTEDPDAADNAAAADTDPVQVQADLAVALDYDGAAAAAREPATLAPGTPVSLRATVVNQGPSISPGSTLIVALDPAATAWTAAATPAQSCLTFGARVVCTIGPLGPGESMRLDIAGRLGPSAPNGPLTMVSTAEVAAATASPAPDPILTNNRTQAALPIVVAAAADLATTATLTTPVSPGSPLTYVVTTANAGPSDAIDVVVTIAVPAGVLAPVGGPDPAIAGGVCVTGAGGSGGSGGSVITCTYPVLRPGVTARTGVTAIAGDGLTLADALDLRAASASRTPDPDPARSAVAGAAYAPLPGIRAGGRTLAATGAAPGPALLLGALLAGTGWALQRLGTKRRFEDAARLG